MGVARCGLWAPTCEVRRSSLTFKKQKRRTSLGGTYTWELPHIKKLNPTIELRVRGNPHVNF